jgi:hypothetical protein
MIIGFGPIIRRNGIYTDYKEAEKKKIVDREVTINNTVKTVKTNQRRNSIYPSK